MEAPRSRTPLVLGVLAALACLVLALLLVVAVIAGALLYSGGEPAGGASTPAEGPPSRDSDGSDPDAPDGSGPTAPGDDPGGSGGPATPGQPGGSAGPPTPTEDPADPPDAVPEGLVLPPGVEEGQSYLELSTSEDGPVVDVYRDFLCPPCRDFQRNQGDGLIELALRGEITLRVHPRTMLDPTSDPPGYSGRAAHAAVCAYAQDPEKWYPAEVALFEHQPGPAGLPDYEIVYLVNEATGLEIGDCLAEGAYHTWLREVVEPEALERTPGTPTVLIDGQPFTGDLGTYGSVKDAIDAA